MRQRRVREKLRVLLLLHEDLVPPASIAGMAPEEIAAFKTEYDVDSTLRGLGHSVIPLGLSDDLSPMRKALTEWKPHIAFNLLEEFGGEAIFDQNVVSYLELMRTPYTGCGPRGLVLARDKALSKKVLSYHRIRVPSFAVFPLHRAKNIKLPKNLTYPVIVKSLLEEASLGIAQASVVRNEEKLRQRVEFVHESLNTDAIVEEYIAGRELYVSMLGNERVEVLPTWELDISGLPGESDRIATRRVKWDLDYQKRYGIALCRAQQLPQEVERRIAHTSRRIYRLLQLAGYARLDFRLSEDHKLYFIEANANPDIGSEEELALAARAQGLDYAALLDRVLGYGLSRRLGG